ncbi:MAG: hypothetical protein ABI680_03795 [Chthoniobacteraceae bacterium]
MWVRIPSRADDRLREDFVRETLEDQGATICDGRYGYAAWLLESFADTATHEGVCDRVANWRRIGASCGRGCEERKHRIALTR